MAKLVRYGKSSGPLLEVKRSFFEENDPLAAREARLAELYRAQPRRTACRACGSPLPELPAFEKQGIDYFICPICTHLTGAYEDTKEFCAIVYGDDGGAEYHQVYGGDREAFDRRVEAIYLPKAQFLVEALEHEGRDPHDLVYLDAGAGSGHFLAALRALRLTRSSGIEASVAQTASANAMLEEPLVTAIAPDELSAALAAVDADVVSMIGVLEHVRDLHEVLDALKGNGRISYLLASVPLFSLSVYLEMVFPTVFHRQLGVDHTHLFTPESLSQVMRRHGLEPAAEWWFGTDLVDLFRNLRVRLEQTQGREIGEAWSRYIAPMIDTLQLELDRTGRCSEVHGVFRVNA